MMRFLLFAILLAVMTGCSTKEVNQYAGNRPQLDLFSYFQGETKGWGIVQDRSGRLTRQFVVIIDGTIDSTGHLALFEQFHWHDGEQSTRTWVIRSPSHNLYEGEAGDVIGTAFGQAAGNALSWKYVLLLEIDGRKWEVDLDDWMFLQPDDVLINRTQLSKFGFRLGEVTIAFMKPRKE